MKRNAIDLGRVECYSRGDLKTYKDALDLVGKKQPIYITGLQTSTIFSRGDIGKVLTSTDEQYFLFYYKSK